MNATTRLVFVALLGSSLSAQMIRTYDVGSVIAPMKRPFPQDDSGTGVFLPTVPPLRELTRRESLPFVSWGFPGPALEADRLVKLLKDPKLAGSAGLTLWRNRLTFRGSNEKHERLRDLLMMLEEDLHPHLRLEVSFLATKDAPERATLDAEKTRAFLARFPERVMHRSIIRGDIADRVRTGTQRSFVFDWDAEVAQRSVVYDPKVRRIDVGLRLGLIASVLADGRIELLVGIQESSIREPIKPKKLIGRQQVSLHHPLVDSRSIISIGVIDSGGALVLGGVTGRHRLCVIRCQTEPRRPSTRSGLFQVIPLGDILHPVPRVPGLRPPPRAGEEVLLETDVDVSGDAEERIRAATRTTEDAGLDWTILGNQLLILGDAGRNDLMRAVSKRVHGLVRKRAATRHTVSIAIRAGEITAAQAAAYAAGNTDTEQLAPSVPRLGLIATLPGHPFQHIEGSETTFIRDQNVEIAQRASAGNPVMETAFSGISIVGTLRQSLSGGFTLDGSLYHAKVDLDRVDVSEPTARDLDLVSRHLIQQEFRSVPMPRGKWIVTTLRKSPSGDGYVVLMMRTDL